MYLLSVLLFLTRRQQQRPSGRKTLLSQLSPHPHPLDRLVGLVVKASASTAEDPGFESRLRRDFFGVESYQ